ncbi:MAG: response regulator transcription factor [Bifidobacterium sp.]|nr:response regulator transcription factor [Bifidobacterium sp.]
MVSVAILDNDPWVLDSLVPWLKGQPECSVLWATSSSSRALHECLYGNAPQVMLVDLALGTMSGAAFCRQVRSTTARIGLLGITANGPDNYVDDLAAAGAQGVLAKEELRMELPVVVGRLARGLSVQAPRFMDAGDAHLTLSGPNGADRINQPLSERELQVLRLYAQGMTSREIADQLHISLNSVFTFTHRAARKLGTDKRAQTLAKARQYGMV